MRGHKIILLFCDQSLSACEIKNVKPNQKYVCSTCKFNRNKIARPLILKFILSDYNYLKENVNIPPIDTGKSRIDN